MLEESVCRQEYAIAKKTPVLASIVPLCEQLASAGSKDSENCLRLGVPNVVQVVRGNITTHISILYSLYCLWMFFSRGSSSIESSVTNMTNDQSKRASGRKLTWLIMSYTLILVLDPQTHPSLSFMSCSRKSYFEVPQWHPLCLKSRASLLRKVDPSHFVSFLLSFCVCCWLAEHTCYAGNGIDYRGTASRTKTGVECGPWKTQIFYRTADYPELIGGHNFCRNPGGMSAQPWCFLHDMKKYECEVPRCSEYISPPVFFAISLTQYWPSLLSSCLSKADHYWTYLVVPGIGAFVFFILVTCICCYCRRNKSSKSSTVSMSSRNGVTSPTFSMNSGGRQTRNSHEMNSLIPRKNIKATEFGLNSIRFLEELGEGAFGKVYRGELVMPQGAVIPVAIKTLKEDATNKTRNDFQREAELMTDMQHPNIVCLLGVCFRNEPLSMLFEFMSEGDLHEYLISHSPNSDVPIVGKKVLDIQDFLHIATQVAAGMEYLSGHHYVHRDLAARNCLVGDHMTVKISDFGLSRDIYASDYYRIQSKSLLPVRWMPPESILFGKFTSESDVWSFGVVLWEVFSYGHQPYYGYSNQEVIEMIRSRQILRCPEDCPPQIFQLMMECWHELPNKRPTFMELHTRLRNWKAVYSNPSSHSGQGSDSHSQKSSGNSSSQRPLPTKPGPGFPLPPPPRTPLNHYPMTQPNTPVSSTHYSSHTIKPSMGGINNLNHNMNHQHIQQHFSSHQLPTPPPQGIPASFLLQHNGNHFSRPNTPGQQQQQQMANCMSMPRTNQPHSFYHWQFCRLSLFITLFIKTFWQTLFVLYSLYSLCITLCHHGNLKCSTFSKSLLNRVMIFVSLFLKAALLCTKRSFMMKAFVKYNHAFVWVSSYWNFVLNFSHSSCTEVPIKIKNKIVRVILFLKCRLLFIHSNSRQQKLDSTKSRRLHSIYGFSEKLVVTSIELLNIVKRSYWVAVKVNMNFSIICWRISILRQKETIG